MFISIKGIQKYIPDYSVQDVAQLKERLDSRLSEVEQIYVKGEQLSGLLIGEIMECQPHPTHKKLQVCKVNIAESTLRTIVCGAPNARPGLKTVVCVPGGSVLDRESGGRFPINERKMGEIVSEGMLCSPAELGLGDNHDGIIELANDSKVGQPVSELFRDIVVEIENKSLTHRGDTFSHQGMAREFSAIFIKRLAEVEPIKLNMHIEEELAVKLKNEVPTDTPRYTGIAVRNIKVEPSPLWLQIFLNYCGVKPVNNVVDATNYVMLDIGQPLHAFDINKLPAKEITVRKARKGEKLQALDHKTYELDTNTTLITSKDEPIAIAGIIGGDSTKIDENTTDIFIEAANFEMYSIRRSSRTLGIRTDASTRFEKGIDPNLTMPGLLKAVEMILDLAGGVVASEISDIYPEPVTPWTVQFDMNDVRKLIGVDMEKTKIIDVLESLGIEVNGGEKVTSEMLLRPEFEAVVTLTIPTYRRDLKINEDILEEVGRIYGYEAITPTVPKRDLVPAANSIRRAKLHQIRELAAMSGLYEVYTYSMVGDEIYATAQLGADKLIQVVNPLAPELSKLRDQLTPSLIAKLKINLQKNSAFGIFEVSRVVLSRKDTEFKDLPAQPYRLAAVQIRSDEVDAYKRLKGTIELLSRRMLGGGLTVRQAANKSEIPAYLHPGKTGAVVLGETVVGHVGVVNPRVADELNVEAAGIAALEIDLESILSHQAAKLVFKQLSDYPAVTRDLSFWIPAEAAAKQILDLITKTNLEIIDSMSITDLFTNKDGKRSITVRLILQATDHTLTGVEVNNALEQIKSAATAAGYELR